MSAIDCLALGAVAAALAWALVRTIRGARRGRGCAGCPMGGRCPMRGSTDKNAE